MSYSTSSPSPNDPMEARWDRSFANGELASGIPLPRWLASDQTYEERAYHCARQAQIQHKIQAFDDFNKRGLWKRVGPEVNRRMFERDYAARNGGGGMLPPIGLSPPPPSLLPAPSPSSSGQQELGGTSGYGDWPTPASVPSSASDISGSTISGSRPGRNPISFPLPPRPPPPQPPASRGQSPSIISSHPGSDGAAQSIHVGQSAFSDVDEPLLQPRSPARSNGQRSPRNTAPSRAGSVAGSRASRDPNSIATGPTYGDGPLGLHTSLAGQPYVDTTYPGAGGW